MGGDHARAIVPTPLEWLPKELVQGCLRSRYPANHDIAHRLTPSGLEVPQ